MNSFPAFEPAPVGLPVHRPVAQADRIQTIDILRGVALLGILLMNIPYFSMAERFSDAFNHNPSDVNFWLNALITILFEGKIRALFSMILGVGIILFMARKEKAGPGNERYSATGLFFRRMGWLVVFGLIDSHVLLWMGDILYYYGVIGMIAFWFRKMNPTYLALGVPLVAIIGFVLGTHDALSECAREANSLFSRAESPATRSEADPGSAAGYLQLERYRKGVFPEQGRNG